MLELKGIVLNEVYAKKESIGPLKNMEINVNVSNVKASQEFLDASFVYMVSFSPKRGSIKFSGNVYFSDLPKKMAEYVWQWNKKKELPKEVMESLVNIINTTCSVNGVLVTRSINLPPPVTPPTLQLGTKPEPPQQKNKK